MGRLLAETIKQHRYGESWHDRALHFLVGLLAGDGLGQVTIELCLLSHALVVLDPPQHGVEPHRLAVIRLQVLEDTEFNIL